MSGFFINRHLFLEHLSAIPVAVSVVVLCGFGSGFSLGRIGRVIRIVFYDARDDRAQSATVSIGAVMAGYMGRILCCGRDCCRSANDRIWPVNMVISSNFASFL